ncbi:enoyl-CoA hydratase-related protein, partial [Streptomyces sp. NPDC000405]
MSHTQDPVKAAENAEFIQAERSDTVVVVRLDRPKALNALCDQLTRELAEVLDAIEADDSVGAAVLTGSEKAFAAGADIKEMQP